MNLINKEFRDRVTGETLKVIDVYQKIVITKDRDKIDVDRLLDPMYYTPLGENPINEDKKFEIKMEEQVNPKTFGENTLNLFNQMIKSIPESDIPKEDDISIQMSSSTHLLPSSNDSAIIVDNSYDEESEILKKYGAIKRPNIESHNDKFTQFLDSDGLPVPTKSDPINTNPQQHQSQSVGQQDPIVSMFKNVKRLVDLKIDLVVENKIPRLDFIEMMEDSYEVSIIDYLASEFTNNLLQNPTEIKEMISSKIREMVYPEYKTNVKDKIADKSEENKPKSTSTRKSRSKKVDSVK